MGKSQPRDVRFDRLRKLWSGSCPALTSLYARRYLTDFPDDALAWLFLGMTLVDLACYKEAEQALAKAVQLCPAGKCRIPFIQMGHLFDARGLHKRAVEWYRKAIDVAPSHTDGYIYLGSVLAKQGRLREAEEMYRQATRCTTGCTDEAFFNLGLVLRAQERFEEAAGCFREAIRIDPKYRVAKRALRDVELCLRYKRRYG